jgi:6-phosphogluconolactonase
MTARLRVFRDAQDLAETLADETAALLTAAIAARGRATMALPGGRTPTPFLTALGRRDVDWSRVTATLVDDRWLPPDSPDSNAATLRATLLAAAPAIRFIPLYTGAETPEEGEAACAEALRVLDGPFDLMVTGMGEDGHVASLFPDAPALASAWEGTAPCRAMRSPTAPHPRMTLTLPRLLDSRRIVVLITGGAKRAVLEQARAAGPEDAMPVRALLRRGGADTMVCWAP